VRGGDVLMIIAAVAGLFALTAVHALRWSIVLSTLGQKLRYLAAFKMVLVGLFFSQFLPSSIGGDAYRMWALRHTGIPLGRGTSSIIVDRMFGLGATLLVATAALPALHDVLPSAAFRSALWVCASALAASAAVVVLLRFTPYVPEDVDMRGRPFSRAVRRFGNDARTILRSPVALSQALGLSLSVNIAVSLCVWLIARSLAAETSALAFVFVIPVVVLVSTIPISIAGWGVREAAMVVGLGWVGMTSSAALAVSIVFGLALIAIGVVGGVVSLISPSIGGVE